MQRPTEHTADLLELFFLVRQRKPRPPRAIRRAATKGQRLRVEDPRLSPSLPCAPIGNRSQPTTTVFSAVLSLVPFGTVCHRLRARGSINARSSERDPSIRQAEVGRLGRDGPRWRFATSAGSAGARRAHAGGRLSLPEREAAW